MIPEFWGQKILTRVANEKTGMKRRPYSEECEAQGLNRIVGRQKDTRAVVASDL